MAGQWIHDELDQLSGHSRIIAGLVGAEMLSETWRPVADDEEAVVFDAAIAAGWGWLHGDVPVSEVVESYIAAADEARHSMRRRAEMDIYWLPAIAAAASGAAVEATRGRFEWLDHVDDETVARWWELACNRLATREPHRLATTNTDLVDLFGYFCTADEQWQRLDWFAMPAIGFATHGSPVTAIAAMDDQVLLACLAWIPSETDPERPMRRLARETLAASNVTRDQVDEAHPTWLRILARSHTEPDVRIHLLNELVASDRATEHDRRCAIFDGLNDSTEAVRAAACAVAADTGDAVLADALRRRTGRFEASAIARAAAQTALARCSPHDTAD